MKDNKELITRVETWLAHITRYPEMNTVRVKDGERLIRDLLAAIQAQAAEIERLRGGLVRISLLKYQDSCDLLDCVKIAESTLTTNKGE